MFGRSRHPTVDEKTHQRINGRKKWNITFLPNASMVSHKTTTTTATSMATSPIREGGVSKSITRFRNDDARALRQAMEVSPEFSPNKTPVNATTLRTRLAELNLGSIVTVMFRKVSKPAERAVAVLASVQKQLENNPGLKRPDFVVDGNEEAEQAMEEYRLLDSKTRVVRSAQALQELMRLIEGVGTNALMERLMRELYLGELRSMTAKIVGPIDIHGLYPVVDMDSVRAHLKAISEVTGTEISDLHADSILMNEVEQKYMRRINPRTLEAIDFDGTKTLSLK